MKRLAFALLFVIAIPATADDVDVPSVEQIED
jgi:hypothetical protein